MVVPSGIFTSTVVGSMERLSHRATVVPAPVVTCARGATVAVALIATCGADVSVGREAVGVKAAAVSVNCEMTVLAAEVRTAAISGVGSCEDGGEDPHAATNMAMRMTLMSGLSFMKPPF